MGKKVGVISLLLVLSFNHFISSSYNSAFCYISMTVTWFWTPILSIQSKHLSRFTFWCDTNLVFSWLFLEINLFCYAITSNATLCLFKSRVTCLWLMFLHLFLSGYYLVVLFFFFAFSMNIICPGRIVKQCYKFCQIVIPRLLTPPMCDVSYLFSISVQLALMISTKCCETRIIQ